MSIIMPGMKMPTECLECPCAYETEGVSHNYCQAVGYDTELPDEGRPEWCPLIELPPHGRCIDADALERNMSDTVMGDIRGYPYDGDTWDLAFSWLDHADTIIPADTEKEENQE